MPLQGELMEIKEKIDIFEQSCHNLLKREMTELNKKIDTQIEKQILDEIQEYEEKEEFSYQKKLEKLEKELNKQTYSLEMENKKEILNQKKLMQKDLEKQIIEILKDFTQKPEYREVLQNRIEETLEKLNSTQHSVLGILKQDNEKYGDEIRQKYNITIKIIEDNYIGGCILEDDIAGLFIDNTFAGSVYEKLESEMR